MISVDWPSGVIFVPKSDTVLAGTDPITGREIRTYNTDTFRKQLRDLEDDPAGRTFPRTHDFNDVRNFGGTPFSAEIELNLAYYTVEFEDGTYRVVLQGTNNNIADAAVINQVSVQPSNSAGLVTVATGSGVTAQDKQDIADAVWDEAMVGHQTPGTAGRTLSRAEKKAKIAAANS